MKRSKITWEREKKVQGQKIHLRVSLLTGGAQKSISIFFLSFHIKLIEKEGNWNIFSLLIPFKVPTNFLFFACLLFIKYSNNEEIVTSLSPFSVEWETFQCFNDQVLTHNPQRGKAEAKVLTSLDLQELRWEKYEKSLHNSEVF